MATRAQLEAYAVAQALTLVERMTDEQVAGASYFGLRCEVTWDSIFEQVSPIAGGAWERLSDQELDGRLDTLLSIAEEVQHRTSSYLRASDIAMSGTTPLSATSDQISLFTGFTADQITAYGDNSVAHTLTPVTFPVILPVGVTFSMYSLLPPQSDLSPPRSVWERLGDD